MGRIRWSTRRPMLAVLGLALVLGFGLPALSILGDRGWHTHVDVVESPDLNGLYMTARLVQAPFRPRYWRGLRGGFWRAESPCPRDAGRPWSECELEHPEMVTRSGVNEVINPSSRRWAEFDRLKANHPQTRVFKPTGLPIL